MQDKFCCSVYKYHHTQPGPLSEGTEGTSYPGPGLLRPKYR